MSNAETTTNNTDLSWLTTDLSWLTSRVGKTFLPGEVGFKIQRTLGFLDDALHTLDRMRSSEVPVDLLRIREESDAAIVTQTQILSAISDEIDEYAQRTARVLNAHGTTSTGSLGDAFNLVRQNLLQVVHTFDSLRTDERGARLTDPSQRDVFIGNTRRYLESAGSYLQVAVTAWGNTDAALGQVLAELTSPRTEQETTVAEDTAENTENTEKTRAVPRPPKAASRKRPCNKQGGRKADTRRQDRQNGERDSSNERRPSVRKLNRYTLDEYTGAISAVRPGDPIREGSRVVEQPAGNPRPTINAFYDATLLPAGSTVVARWGDNAPELDPQVVARLGRLATLAGYGKVARKKMFDQIARSANPNAALSHIIVALGGADALERPAGELTTTVTGDELPALVLAGLNAGNDELIDFASNLPSTLTPHARLVEHLSTAPDKLPGHVEFLREDGSGTELGILSSDFSKKRQICDSLREAGGRNIEVKNTHVEREGRKMRAFIVSARFAAAPIEVAAARTGVDPMVRYRVTDDGTVVARYETPLYGTIVDTPDIPCDPSPLSVAELVKHLAERDESLRDTLTKIDAAVSGSPEVIALRLGPVRTLDQLRERIATVDLTADTVLGEGYTARLEAAGDHIRSADGRRVPVRYDQGVAMLDEFSLHPTDQRTLGLPEAVDGLDDDMPATVRQIRFETKKGSKRPSVIEESVEVAELNARRERFLAKREPREALLVECRENFLAEATRTMAAALITPPTTREEVRNPEGLAKRVTFSRTIDPYLATGGELVHLVQVLANSQPNTMWSTWCRDQVKAYRDTVARLRRENRDIPQDFFAVLGMNAESRNILLDAAGALMSERLGQQVSDEDVTAFATQAAEAIRENSFIAVDRGRALANHLKAKTKTTA